MPKDNNWKRAKELLIEDIASGFITEAMLAEEVMELRAEYSVCLPENFKRNFLHLRNNLKNKAETALKDTTLLLSDLNLHTVEQGNRLTVYPRWSGSVAEAELKKDIEDKLHEVFKPKDLWMRRISFQAYPLDIFRKHYFQVIYSKKGKSYWQNRSNNRTTGHP